MAARWRSVADRCVADGRASATKTPPLASFFGFRSRTLTFSLVSFLCAIFLLFLIWGWFVVLLCRAH